MPNIADYLDDLIAQRNALADNLTAKGVPATHAEKFNSLVHKVLEISTVPQAHKNTPDVGVSYNYEITD